MESMESIEDSAHISAQMENDVNEAVTAGQQGRHRDALHLLAAVFERQSGSAELFERHNFITMFAWSLLVEHYPPAYDAMAGARDKQVRRLLDGDETIGAGDDSWQRSRFRLIVNMNNTLDDSRSTYDLFVRLRATRPELAQREAFLAIPAVVEVGDYALAEPYLGDPLQRLAELNQLADELPLFPPPRSAPRLAAELSNFMQDVRLRTTVLQGLGRTEEADALRSAVLAGIVPDRMRELARRELAAPGTIHREVAERQALPGASGGQPPEAA